MWRHLIRPRVTLGIGPRDGSSRGTLRGTIIPDPLTEDGPARRSAGGVGRREGP